MRAEQPSAQWVGLMSCCATDLAVRKQRTDLVRADASHIRIPRIVEAEIKPEDDTAGFRDPNHLGGDLLLVPSYSESN